MSTNYSINSFATLSVLLLLGSFVVSATGQTSTPIERAGREKYDQLNSVEMLRSSSGTGSSPRSMLAERTPKRSKPKASATAMPKKEKSESVHRSGITTSGAATTEASPSPSASPEKAATKAKAEAAPSASESPYEPAGRQRHAAPTPPDE